jgi:acetolactate synthase-1/3 small subunit
MENQPGALSRVVGLFSQRGYNIDSLSVAPTQEPTLSRLTMTTSEEPEVINQILRQLFKLIDVVMVQNLTSVKSFSIELAIIKLALNTEEVKKIIDGESKISCNIVNETEGFTMFEVKGESLAIDDFLSSLKDQEFLEVTRSGQLCMTTGMASLRTNDQTKISYD